MLKNATYKDKFSLLNQWFPLIIEAIKRDLRNEHLRNDLSFIKRYFPGKNPLKLTSDELAAAYADLLEHGERGEEMGEFIANRWLVKHGDLYHHFEQELSKITPDFAELEEIEKERALPLIEGAIDSFGPVKTYLFSILNSVVFPEEVYRTLNERALRHVEQEAEKEVKKAEAASLEAMKNHYEQQIARLTDKYEKKLLGLEKKYVHDTACLKKQLAALQKK